MSFVLLKAVVENVHIFRSFSQLKFPLKNVNWYGHTHIASYTMSYWLC